MNRQQNNSQEISVSNYSKSIVIFRSLECTFLESENYYVPSRLERNDIDTVMSGKQQSETSCSLFYVLVVVVVKALGLWGQPVW